MVGGIAVDAFPRRPIRFVVLYSPTCLLSPDEIRANHDAMIAAFARA